jgi:hypothetical protein
LSGTPADILSEVVRGRTTGLTGRRGERDVLDRLIDAVGAGEGRALVVTGYGLRTADVEHLRGQIAFDQRRISEAARLLLSAARHLEPLNADSARETYLEALGAAVWTADLGHAGGLLETAEAAPAAPSGPRPTTGGGRPARRICGAADRALAPSASHREAPGTQGDGATARARAG